MTDNNSKLRAVLLAALMVLWVFAGTMAFAGGAAADDGNYAESGAEQTWESQNLRWQGQTLYFEAANTGGANTEADYQLREANLEDADESGSLVREFSLAQGESRAIDTSELEGDYVISKNDRRDYVVTGQDGVEDTTSNAAADAYVEIAVQDLDTSFEDDSVNLGDNSTVEVESNRGDYTLNITSDSFTADELEELFPDATVESSEDDVASISATDRDELNFTTDVDFDLETGEDYDFDFEVQDTTASDSANITVGEEVEGDADFESAQFTEQRGDIVNITYETEELDSSNTTLTIGGSDQGYTANVTAEPDDNGVVSIEFNTWLAGNHENVDATAEDAVEVTNGDLQDANQTDLTRALEDGLYDLSVTNAQNQELDVAVMQLEERSTDELTVHTAPRSEFTRLSDKEGVYERIDNGQVTEDDDIALEDSIVLKVDASGLEGYIAAQENTEDQAGLGEMINSSEFSLEMEQENPSQNDLPKQLDTESTFGADNTAFQFVPDGDNDTLFIVADTDELVFDRSDDPLDTDEIGNGEESFEDGDEFNTTFTVESDFRESFIRDAQNNETVSDEFEIVDREAEFDTVDDEVRVAPADGAEITGETTVAPGTEFNVRARATGESPFLLTNETTVAEDGSFVGTFDFSDVSAGQNFTASIRGQGFEDNVETDGVVQETDFAEVEISNQTTDGTTATVDRVYLPDGGFVTIHDGTLLDGATFDSVRGTSDYLESGEHTDVEVTLDTPYEGDNGTVIAMPHEDSNDNEEYDFVTSEGDDDAPYLNADGEIVLDSATLTVDTSTPTPTATATATPEPSTPTEEPATDEPTETESEDQPGFGAVIALIALLGAALLAARRNAF